MGWLPKKTIVILGGMTLTSAFIYLTAAAVTLRTGFPLDDAWIHQVYARNLAVFGEFSFQCGQVSAGSTSLLWSFILSAGYLLGISAKTWAYICGSLCLFGVGWLGELIFRKWTGYGKVFPLAGAVIMLEWHMGWSAVSGMEICLYCLVIMGIVYLLTENKPRWLLTGLLAGLSVWVRPDGITLAGMVFVMALFQWRSYKGKPLLFSLIGVSLGLGTYYIFNQVLFGVWAPNTFFAKQAEYLIYQQIPLLTRLLRELGLPLIGVGVALLPGLGYAVYQSIRDQNWIVIAAILWMIGYAGIYAWKLPVTYQHGRYVMPVIPVMALIGVCGVSWAVGKMTKSPVGRIVAKAWILIIGIVLAAFTGLGARAYSVDVAVIESEMVETAKWLAANTSKDAILAVHDIGAVGYYSGRELIDLAGLITPEVIPFIRNEEKLAQYISNKGAAYLVTFPDWYPHLVMGREIIFSSGGTFSGEHGNMTVYRWR